MGLGSSVNSMLAAPESKWYAPWQQKEHAVRFSFREALDDRNLVRLYETLNDVRLLKERFRIGPPMTLLEVGCATGDFYRYLRLALPHLSYCGLDLSPAAVERARSKYPEGNFLACEPGSQMLRVWEEKSGCRKADLVYASDVLHHQTEPFTFLCQLLRLASVAVLLRCRTRDVGPTEWNAARSRQLNYGGSVPYIVINMEELIGRIRREAPSAEVVVHRSRVVLGDRYGRRLPPACSLRRTGTAETSVGIFLKTDRPGSLSIRDRRDNRPNTTWDHKLRSLLGRLRVLRLNGGTGV
ncbi:MAG: class I SAM-dependent methyltransferase [Candidatus Omnitrophica bacterium]|nr:class I SAM-dependent methyltransferase [Candidatus Omnitrophota bacterium]